jgi:hypothetical protein
MQLPKIAVIQKPADHVCRDLRSADRVKLAPVRKIETEIQAVDLGFEPGLQNVGRIDHDYAASAAIRMAVGQPEEGHRGRAFLA